MVRITEQLVRKKSEHNELIISTLEELSLHQEDIECIENLHNWCRDLKILLLQSNLISKIENLFKLKKLEYLNLALNNIERIENLESLESLNKLDLTINFIGELTSVESLKGNYNLRELILTGNPCCDYPNYREFVIATLPQLQNLDCKKITATQKLEVLPNLKKYREIIVQKQAEYAMRRDEQKIRYQQQKQELQTKIATIEDEEQRTKAFWDAKSEHCPEIRYDIAKYHNRSNKRHPCDVEKDERTQKKEIKLFAPCGRPYNLNKPQLNFSLKDEYNEYILELDVYKYLDTSLLKVDVEINYIRVAVKGKIFQIALNDEINHAEAIVQRSQTTGQLMIKVPKLQQNELLHIKSTAEKCTGSTNIQRKSNKKELKGTVNISKICQQNNTGKEDEIPDLI